MSELVEIRQALSRLQETAAETATVVATTANDVSWIKSGMELGRQRMDGHDDRLGKLENQQSRRVGFAAAVSGILAAVATAIFDHLRQSWMGHIL